MLINIVIDAINEIKDCWHLAKQAPSKVHKGTYLSLMYMNVLFLPVYLIPILYSIMILGGSFLYGPIVLLGLLFTIPFILFVRGSELEKELFR
jgi:hypothetical protein